MHFSVMYRLRWYPGRSRAMGRQTSAGGGNKPFSGFKRQYLKNGRRYVQSYY